MNSWSIGEIESQTRPLTCSIDPIQDLDVAARGRADGSGDCQQWNAFSAVVAGGRWSGAGSYSHYFLGIVCVVHKLAAHSIQAEAS